MSTHRSINRICCAVLALALLVTVLFCNAERLGIQRSDSARGYEARLFDTTRVHTIDIVMDDWEGFLETCENEEYESCAVVIDNEAYKNVAIRAKGNTSLSMVKSYGNNRYSFKIEFDHYDSGNTYYGLDKLCLNNIIQDNTYLKDYLAYTLMQDMGVPSPLCSFVDITVNGEDWGLYLAVEAVEDAFLARNYGNAYGELYKPDSTGFGGGRGNGKGFDMDDLNLDGQENRSEGFRDHNNGAPEMPEGFPDSESGMPEPPEGFPDSEASMPEPPEGFPDSESGMPEPPEGFPDSETSMPEPPEGFPDSENGMPGLPEGFPDSESGMPEPPEGFPDSENGMPEPPEGFPANDETQTGQSPTNDSGRSSDGSTDPFSQFGEGGRRNGGGGGPGGMGSSDVKLQYIDDDPDSYSNIFDNAKTDITDADKTRLIASLKNLSENEDIENTVNVEEVIRYFVVHNFLCNDDSYTGGIVHNYYLYEDDGQLSMLPWDYNLSFGGFGGGGGGFGGASGGSGATGTVNSPIDSPVSSGSLEDRPMVAWIFADESYTALYHQYYAEFLSAAESGLSDTIDRVSQLIRPYVEKDPTKFCTLEEFDTGIATLLDFCALRLQSIRGQLDGSIPSTSEGQQDSTALIDASEITLSDMGSMNHGGGMGGFGGRPDSRENGNTDNGTADVSGNRGTSGGGTQPLEDSRGHTSADSAAADSDAADSPPAAPGQPSGDSVRPSMGNPGSGPGGEAPQEEQPANGLPLLAVSVVILLAGLLFALKFKR